MVVLTHRITKNIFDFFLSLRFITQKKIVVMRHYHLSIDLDKDINAQYAEHDVFFHIDNCVSKKTKKQIKF